MLPRLLITFGLGFLYSKNTETINSLISSSFKSLDETISSYFWSDD